MQSGCSSRWVAAPDHLPKVVGGHVGAHPHGDAAGAVDQQVGEPRGKDGRLLQPVVEVRREAHRLPVDVGEQLGGDQRQLRLRVAVGRRAVAVDGAEVPLPRHQRVAQGEVLHHPHQRVVDRGVAVRVVLAQDVSHHRRALLEGAARREPRLVHRVENAPVDRLQPVAHVGERTLDDHAHGVVEERLLHLVLDQAHDHAVSLLCHHGLSQVGFGFSGRHRPVGSARSAPRTGARFGTPLIPRRHAAVRKVFGKHRGPYRAPRAARAQVFRPHRTPGAP